MSTESSASLPPRYPSTVSDWYFASRFILMHLACFAAIWTGVPWQALILCAALYVARMFGVSAGYHRYFSHRTYKMGRIPQFLMACLAQSSMQRGVLWWAAHHRHHHKYSDQPEDVHSVRQDGFFWSHVGWVFSPRWTETDISRVKDLARYPELRFLNRHPHIPAMLLAALCFLWMGWAGLVVGFIWSTVILWHGTFTINSLAHVIGKRRYDTGDDSRNNWFLAIITLGEGWHNNHHHYQASVNQGFFWWEFDISYYILWTLSKLGLVHDLRRPPRHVIENRPHPGALLKKAAQHARQQLDQRVLELKTAAQKAREEAAQRVEDLGSDLTALVEEMSHDVEERIEELRADILHVRRDTHAKLDQWAGDASAKLDALAQDMATAMAQLRTRSREHGERAARAIDDIAEVTEVLYHTGSTISQS